MEEKEILYVGLISVDIVSVCNAYPVEDSDQRVLEQDWQTGGNALNSARVSSYLGQKAFLLGTLANDYYISFLNNELREAEIDFSYCVTHSSKRSPVSVIILNITTGSRTILHTNPNLPEISLNDFKAVDLNRFNWIHFEGRNINVVPSIISKIRSASNSIKISVEIEKPNLLHGTLLPLADIVFISKDYMKLRGFTKKEDCGKLSSECKEGCVIICAWGEDGAAGFSNGELVSVPAYKPTAVVDTLGAGDTFVAATILALRRGFTLRESLEFGCRVAGFKCGMRGYKAIKQESKMLLSCLSK